jgi:hypothetical protein
LARLYLENIHYKKGAGGVAQGEGPEFKLQYQKKGKPINITENFQQKF